MGAAFGGQDIDFVEHTDFSEKYALKAESEEEVRIYMDTVLLDLFAAQNKICCEAREGGILYYHRYKRVDPAAEQLQKFMEEAWVYLKHYLFASHVSVEQTLNLREYFVVPSYKDAGRRWVRG